MVPSFWSTLTKTIWFIVRRLSGREKTLEDASWRKDINTLLCAPRRNQRREVHSIYPCISTKHSATWTSREFSIPLTWIQPKMKSFHILFLKKRKRSWTRPQSGRLSLWRNRWSIWWRTRTLAPISEQRSRITIQHSVKTSANIIQWTNIMSNEALAEQRAKFRLTTNNIKKINIFNQIKAIDIKEEARYPH